MDLLVSWEFDLLSFFILWQISTSGMVVDGNLVRCTRKSQRICPLLFHGMLQLVIDIAEGENAVGAISIGMISMDIDNSIPDCRTYHAFCWISDRNYIIWIFRRRRYTVVHMRDLSCWTEVCSGPYVWLKSTGNLLCNLINIKLSISLESVGFRKST